MSTNGQRPPDTKAEQRWQEGTQGFHLQQSPSATGGGDGREKGWKVVHLENASQGRTFYLQAETSEEVMAGIFRESPSLLALNLGIRFFGVPKEVRHRVPLESLSNLSEVWASVYLRKH